MIEMALVPGIYETGDVVADFREDGTFAMQNEARGSGVTGSWTVEGGVLTLSEPEGDLRRGIDFPLDCALENAEEGGFLLGDSEDGSCGPLSGASFTARQ
jgi:hypothetical protein